jgi:hypothetical protein
MQDQLDDHGSYRDQLVVCEQSLGEANVNKLGHLAQMSVLKAQVSQLEAEARDAAVLCSKPPPALAPAPESNKQTPTASLSLLSPSPLPLSSSPTMSVGDDAGSFADVQLLKSHSREVADLREAAATCLERKRALERDTAADMASLSMWETMARDAEASLKLESANRMECSARVLTLESETMRIAALAGQAAADVALALRVQKRDHIENMSAAAAATASTGHFQRQHCPPCLRCPLCVACPKRTHPHDLNSTHFGAQSQVEKTNYASDAGSRAHGVSTDATKWGMQVAVIYTVMCMAMYCMGIGVQQVDMDQMSALMEGASQSLSFVDQKVFLLCSLGLWVATKAVISQSKLA